MRILFRIILTLLVAVLAALPVALGIALFFALQVLRGGISAPKGGGAVSSESSVLAEADSSVHYASGHADQHQGLPTGR